MLSMRAVSFLIISMAVGWFLCSLCEGAGTVQIDRFKIEERLLPGETKEGKIQVTNDENQIMRLKIYTQDWSYTSTCDGTKNFSPAGLMPCSCSPWIQIYPDQLTLPPKQSQDIRYIISVPQDAKGGYQSVIFFESILGQSERGKEKVVTLSARLASLVFLEVRGTVSKQGVIRSLTLTRQPGSKVLEMKLVFENRGNTHLIFEPMFDLFNPEGMPVARGTFAKIYTLPGNTATVATQWLGGLAEGVYDLVLTLDLGDDQILVREWKIKVDSTGAIQETLS